MDVVEHGNEHLRNRRFWPSVFRRKYLPEHLHCKGRTGAHRLRIKFPGIYRGRRCVAERLDLPEIGVPCFGSRRKSKRGFQKEAWDRPFWRRRFHYAALQRQRTCFHRSGWFHTENHAWRRTEDHRRYRECPWVPKRRFYGDRDCQGHQE